MLPTINGKSFLEVTEDDLKVLVENADYRESDYIDYKRNFAFLEIAKEKKQEKIAEFRSDVCAFANSEGGYLIFGVSDENGCASDIPGIDIPNDDTDRFELDRRNNLTPFIMASSRNINFDTLLDLENVRYLCQRDYEIENARTNIKAGDILLTTVATLGRSCIYNGFPKNLCFQRSVTVISTDILPEYLKLFFDAPYFQKFIFNNATGTAQKGFYLNQLENVLVCVPPLGEQTRMAQTAGVILKQLLSIEKSLN